jgi:hypothetical protein
MEFTEVVLHRLSKQVTHNLGPYTASKLEAEAQIDQVTQGLLVKLRTELLATQRIKHEDTYSVQVPKTWWDHLKLSLPAWMIRWVGKPAYGEVILTTKFAEYMSYPRIDIVPPRTFGPAVTVQVGWTSLYSDWKVITKRTGQEIPDPYLSYPDAYGVIHEELLKAVDSSSWGTTYTWTIDSFLQALGRLGVNVEELVRK